MNLINQINQHKAVFDDLQNISDDIQKASEILLKVLKNKNKILSCGNGGSSCDSEHFVSELVGRFKKDRKALGAISLTSNNASITSISNDYGYDEVFSRQIDAYANSGDCLVVFSTSAKSKNIIKAIDKARDNNCFIICLSGQNKAINSDKIDINICINSTDTPRIQEAHIFLCHIFCDFIEKNF